MIIGNQNFDFENKKYIQGILNVTPDSFYDGGKSYNLKDAVKNTEQMIKDGADIIDVGGMSTRPFSEEISINDEIERVKPVIIEIKKNFDIPISIDTYRSEVANACLDSGADMVNDVFGFSYDKEMINTVKRYDVPIIIMHIKGNPKTMQEKPYYDDVVGEISEYFDTKIKYAENNGFPAEKLILDVGIGFGKRLKDNLKLIKEHKSFLKFQRPLLIGLSRKSFIGKFFDSLEAEKRLTGSLIFGFISLLNGVSILRVHDVFETKQMIKIFKEMI